jgi:hypothetical protein
MSSTATTAIQNIRLGSQAAVVSRTELGCLSRSEILTQREVSEIESAVPAGAVAGTRYNEAILRNIDRSVRSAQ